MVKPMQDIRIIDILQLIFLTISYDFLANGGWMPFFCQFRDAIFLLLFLVTFDSVKYFYDCFDLLLF